MKKNIENKIAFTKGLHFFFFLPTKNTINSETQKRRGKNLSQPLEKKKNKQYNMIII